MELGRYLDDTNRAVTPAARPLQHLAEARAVLRWVPLDEDELRRNLEAVRLRDEPVDEELRAIQGIAAVIVVARGRDHAEILGCGVAQLAASPTSTAIPLPATVQWCRTSTGPG